MDVTEFRLRRLNRADLIDEIKARFPGGGRGNLARITRFPLGLPVGWAVPTGEAWGRDVTADTDPARTGPSGTAALKIVSTSGATLTAAPFFVPWTFAPHVLSLSLCGQGSGQIVVRGEGRTLATQDFTLSPQWQRVAVPFTPLFEGKAHDFQIRVTGTAWVDALQVEQGSSATPYVPPMPAEVALACPPSEAGLVRIQFPDEPDRLTYAVANPAPGDLLHAQVTDAYEETRPLPTAPLTASGRGSLRYAVFPAHPQGCFRVTAWVTDAHGRRRSGDGEIVVSRLPRPRFWGRDAPQSPFGVHINPTPQQALLAKAIGANWVRTHDCGLEITGWSFLEPVHGQWQFQDAEAATYRSRHLEILGMISTAPGWATSLGRPANGYWDRYVQPNSMEDWGEYVRRVVTHYKGVIDDYEVWNEPGGDYWGVWDDKQGHSVKTPDSPAQFARLQRTAYAEAKRADPAVTVLGFSDSGTATILASDVLPNCDVLSYHDYTGEVNGAANDEVSKTRAEAVKPILATGQAMTKPVWESEGNPVNGMLDVGLYQATVPGVAPDKNWDTSDRLSRFVISLLAHGDAKTFLYTMHEDSALGMGGGDWRTLLTADGFLHPCGAAYAALTWQIEGLHPVKTGTPVPGVTAFTFAGPGRRVVVYAGSPGHVPFVLPHGAGITATDLFGNPLPSGTRLGAALAYVTEALEQK